MSSAKLPRADSTGDKSVFPGWRRFAVHQRRAHSGWFPTCYEMLLRAAGVEGIDYRTFQDEFDLDINLGRDQTQPPNNSVSVAQAVNEKYPHVHRSLPGTVKAGPGLGNPATRWPTYGLAYHADRRCEIQQLPPVAIGSGSWHSHHAVAGKIGADQNSR